MFEEGVKQRRRWVQMAVATDQQRACESERVTGQCVAPLSEQKPPEPPTLRRLDGLKVGDVRQKREPLFGVSNPVEFNGALDRLVASMLHPKNSSTFETLITLRNSLRHLRHGNRCPASHLPARNAHFSAGFDAEARRITCLKRQPCRPIFRTLPTGARTVRYLAGLRPTGN